MNGTPLVPPRSFASPRMRRGRTVVEIVAYENGIAPEALLMRRQWPDLVALRVEVMRQLRAEGFSLPEIGRVFKMHHCTVLHHLRKENKNGTNQHPANVDEISCDVPFTGPSNGSAASGGQ